MDVVAWLRGLGLERYAPEFRDNDVDGEVLPELTSDDLISIGVTSVGHRRKLLAAIASLGATPPAATVMAAPRDTPAPADAERRQLTVMFCDLVAADQPRQRRSAQCLERARDCARRQHLPNRHRSGDALQLDGAEITVVEEIADQPACARGDDDRVRLGQGLQPGGEVRRFADDRLFLRRAFADQIADDHQPGGDPDARLELDGFESEATHCVDQTQPRPDRPLGIILMRSRVTEIDQDAVARIFGDKAVQPGDDLGDGALIGGDAAALGKRQDG